MGKIIIFPSSQRGDTSKEPILTKSIILEELKQLAWNDPEAFLTLEVLCLSDLDLEVTPRVREKLKKLNSTDSSGYPLPISRTIICEITKDAEDAVIAK